MGKLLSGLVNPPLRQLCEAILADPDIMTRFKLAPAAKSMHHAYIGGLLEHTVSVVTLIYRICNHYPDLDRDLLMTGAFLHDIGKIEEFVYDTSIDYSDSGRLVGHMVLGTQMVEDKIRRMEGFPVETAILVKHLILSHHGEAQFGAVSLPASREAFALHLADDLDAKMNAIGRIIANPANDGSSWTGFETIFGRRFFRGFPKQSDAAGGDEVSEERGNRSLSVHRARGHAAVNRRGSGNKNGFSRYPRPAKGRAVFKAASEKTDRSARFSFFRNGRDRQVRCGEGICESSELRRSAGL